MNMSLQKSPRGVWVKKLSVKVRTYDLYHLLNHQTIQSALMGVCKKSSEQNKTFWGFYFSFPPLICHVFLFVCDFWVCMHEHSLPWTSYSRKSLLSVSLYCIKETVVLIFFLIFSFCLLFQLWQRSCGLLQVPALHSSFSLQTSLLPDSQLCSTAPER